MKHLLTITLLALLPAIATAQQITFSGGNTSESEVLKLCGTKTPLPGFYADEYGQIWDVRCNCGIAYQSESGHIVHCACWNVNRVNTSPIRPLPIRLKPVFSQSKYQGA